MKLVVQTSAGGQRHRRRAARDRSPGRWPTAHRIRSAAGSLRGDAALLFLLVAFLAGVGASVAINQSFPNWSSDEPPHLGYVESLRDGTLPTISTPTIKDPAAYDGLASDLAGKDAAHDVVWTANHPPLFPALLVPIWSADVLPVSVRIVAMRLVNTLLFCCWLVASWLLMRDLAPRRPALVALATALSITPVLAMRSGFLMNDGLAATAGTVLVLAAGRLLRTEDQRYLWLAAAAGVVAAGTRASGVVVVAVTCLVTLVVWGHRHGWLAGARRAALIGGVPALVWGWFYLRNLGLYGDLTGQQALLTQFGRSPVRHPADLLADPGTKELLLTSPLLVLMLVVAAPSMAAYVVRRRRNLDPTLWTGIVLGGLLLIQLAQFRLAGGGFHDRYLIPVLPFLTLGLGWVLLGGTRAVPGSRADWRAASVWILVSLVWTAAVAIIITFDAPATAVSIAAVALVVIAGTSVTLARRHRAAPAPGDDQVRRGRSAPAR